jgi:putative ABC transport system permease protein
MKISTLARKNARQSISVILMIILASMLICTVTNLGFSVQQGIINNVLEYTGDNQVRLNNITEEQAVWLSEQKEIALADLYLSLRGLGEKTEDTYDNIGITYSSGLGYVANFKLTTGRAPQADNEAVIPPHLAELLGIEPAVGAEFEILYYGRSSDGTQMDAVTLRFVVCGVLQEQRMYAAMGFYDMFISKSLAEQLDYDQLICLKFHPKYDPRSTAIRLAEEIGVPEKDVSFNESYLTAELNDPTTVIFVAVILLILSAAGALVIYNAYNLSVVKKIHQYGLLTVIGASKKQIRRCVYLEALFCTGIGLPVGLLTGTLIGYVSISALNGIANYPTTYVLAPAAYLLSAIVTLVMVLIGVRRPAKKASKIAPVEAVRFADTDEKAGKRKQMENVTLNSLAKINLSRARGRTVGTIMSLSLSGILFLGFSTVAFSMRDSADGIIKQTVYGDIQLTAGRYGIVQKKSDPLTHEMVETIRALDGVQKTTTVMEQGLCEIVKTPNGEDYPDDRGDVIGVTADVLQEVIAHIYDGEVTPADFEDPRNVIAVIPTDYKVDYYTNNYKIDYANILKSYEVGNHLDFTLTGSNSWFTDKTAVLNIIGLVREEDISRLMYGYGIYPDLYTLQDSFAALGWDTTYDRVILNIDSAKHDDIYIVIEQLCGNDTDLNLESFVRMKDELTRQLTGLIAVVLLMLGVVVLNGVMNLIGSTVMGIEQRKKELGVLMAVGLSRKAVGKMLTREGLWTSLFCSVLSVVFGLGFGIGLYNLVVCAGADYMHFVFPIWPLFSLCAVLGFVPYAVTILASRGLRRATIVELLGRWV